MELLGRVVEVGEQVEPEGGAGGEPLADRVVDLALGALQLRVGGRRAGEADVLAEVEGDAAVAAAERAGADPDHLAAGAELVEPGRRVGAEPARQHVPLPDLRRQRDALQRHQRLAQAVGPGAGARGRRRRSASSAGSGRAGRASAGLDLACAGGRGWRGGPGAGLRSRTTRARCRRAAARRGPAPLRAPARAAPASGRRRSARRAARSGRGRGCGRSGGPGRASRRGGPRGRSPAGRAAAARRARRGRGRRPRRRCSAPRRRSGPAATRRSATSFSSIEVGRVALGDPLLALLRGQVAEVAQHLLQGVAVAGAAGLGAVLELRLDLLQRLGVDQLAQLLLAEQLAQQVAVEGQRRGAPLGVRRVPLVHVGGDVVEEQRGGEGRGGRRLDLDQAELARVQLAQQLGAARAGRGRRAGTRGRSRG